MRFRKKPLEFEAMQINSFNFEKVLSWARSLGFAEGIIFPMSGARFLVRGEPDRVAEVGDWIVQGACKRLYPIKDEIFQIIAEPMEVQVGSKAGMDKG